MAHLFVAYLALGNSHNTPRRVTHSNYGRRVRQGRNVVIYGESGRWLENTLYGGAIEFYRDIQESDDQVFILTIIPLSILINVYRLVCLICWLMVTLQLSKLNPILY